MSVRVLRNAHQNQVLKVKQTFLSRIASINMYTRGGYHLHGKHIPLKTLQILQATGFNQCIFILFLNFPIIDTGTFCDFFSFFVCTSCSTEYNTPKISTRIDCVNGKRPRFHVDQHHVHRTTLKQQRTFSLFTQPHLKMSRQK